jgi:HK97 family phage major capsid protein
MDPKEIQKLIEDIVSKIFAENAKGAEASEKLIAELSEKMTQLEKDLKDSIRKEQFGDGADPKDKAAIKHHTGHMIRSIVCRDQKGLQESIGKLHELDAFGKTKAGLTEGTDAAGGFLVPTEFEKEIIRVLDDYGFARKYGKRYPMMTDEKKIGKVTDGGTVYWVGEGAAMTASKPTLAQVTLTAKKLAALSYATIEVLEDATISEVWDIVMSEFRNLIAAEEDAQFLAGDNTIFRGILNLASANIETFASGDTSFEDLGHKYLVNLVRSVPMKYKRGFNPRWVMHQDIIAIVEKLKDSQGNPIFRALGDPDKMTLLGYPVELHDQMPAISDDGVGKKFIAFGDPIFMAFGERKGIRIETSRHATITDSTDVSMFQTDQEALKMVERIAIASRIDQAFAVGKTAAS